MLSTARLRKKITYLENEIALNKSLIKEQWGSTKKRLSTPDVLFKSFLAGISLGFIFFHKRSTNKASVKKLQKKPPQHTTIYTLAKQLVSTVVFDFLFNFIKARLSRLLS